MVHTELLIECDLDDPLGTQALQREAQDEEAVAAPQHHMVQFCRVSYPGPRPPRTGVLRVQGLPPSPVAARHRCVTAQPWDTWSLLRPSQGAEGASVQERRSALHLPCGRGVAFHLA